MRFSKYPLIPLSAICVALLCPYVKVALLDANCGHSCWYLFDFQYNSTIFTNQLKLFL